MGKIFVMIPASFMSYVSSFLAAQISGCSALGFHTLPDLSSTAQCASTGVAKA